MGLLELFCHVDDFWLVFAPVGERERLNTGVKQRRRAGQLCANEIMKILIYFHQMRYRDFKIYYTQFVQAHLRSEFPRLVSYNRFVELIPSVFIPLCAYLQSCYGECTGISFIDSTPLAVCHNRPINHHRTFAGVAQRGKNSVGWFFGFKLHLVVQRLWGKLFGDKGYLSLDRATPPARHLPHRQTQVQHEEPLDPARRQAAVAQALHSRNHHRSIEKHLAD